MNGLTGPILVRDTQRFTVTVRDSDRDRVTLRLLNPPPGMVFDPVVDAPSPATVEVHWNVPITWAAERELWFEAWDDVDPARRTRVIHAPVALLRHPDGFHEERIGDTGGGVAFQLVDAGGDGVLDVVAGAMQADVGGQLDAGRVFWWRGGESLSGIQVPTAVLSRPNPVAGDLLGQVGQPRAFGGEGILLAEVTGDGTLHLLVGAIHADLPGVPDAGGIELWSGPFRTGTGITTLVAPGARPGDLLGD